MEGEICRVDGETEDKEGEEGAEREEVRDPASNPPGLDLVRSIGSSCSFPRSCSLEVGGKVKAKPCSFPLIGLSDELESSLLCWM